MSSGKVIHEVDISKVTVQEEKLVLDLDSGSVKIDISDVIGCQIRDGSQTVKDFKGFSSSAKANVLFIVRPHVPDTYRWTVGVVNISGEEQATSKLVETLQGKLQGLGRPQKLLVLLNPIGGNQRARKLFAEVIAPLLEFAGIQHEVLVSERANHMSELVMSANLAEVQGVMVLGGDGTLGEVINGMVKRKQGADLSAISHIDPLAIPIGIMPTGTANVMCKNIQGTRDLTTAVLHVIKGGVVKRGLQGVYNKGALLGVACWSTAYGLFADMLFYNDKHRWLRRLRAVVVPLWFFLFKSHRLYDAKVTYQLRAKEETEDSQGEMENVEKEESDTYSTVMAMNANMVDQDTTLCITPEDLCRREEFSLFCYRQCTRFQLIQHLGQLASQNRDCFKRDFLTAHNVVGFKVKLTGQQNQDGPVTPGMSPGKRPEESDLQYLNRVLNIDGEFYEFGDQEFEVKLFPNTVMYYHSS